MHKSDRFVVIVMRLNIVKRNHKTTRRVSAARFDNNMVVAKVRQLLTHKLKLLGAQPSSSYALIDISPDSGRPGWPPTSLTGPPNASAISSTEYASGFAKA